MKSLKLCLHCGANEVDFETVEQVPTPAATRSHRPIPHHDLVNRVKIGLKDSNLELVEEAHAVNKTGERYFGLMQVRMVGMNAPDYSLVMGIRNSHDKVFPAGLVVGSGVFVCDNLSFSGEMKLFRRHTTNIMNDLPLVIAKAIGGLSQKWNDDSKRFEAYKETQLNDLQAHDLMIRALHCGAVPVTKLAQIAQEWRTPSHEEFTSNNVWRLFNGFTEGLKGNLIALPARTMALHSLLDGHCGLINRESN